MMSRFNLSAWAVAHPALMLFLIVMLGAAGLFFYRSLGRAEDPSFTIKVVVVTAMWPGSTAAEMQTQVADPIEKKLQELPYFDKVTTYNKPSFTAMQVAFKDNTPAREVPQLFYQLRKKINDIKVDLPAGLIGNGWLATLSPREAPTMMLTLLMIQLQSISRLILVFLTAPLGIAIVEATVRRTRPVVLRGCRGSTAASARSHWSRPAAARRQRRRRAP
jgi:multidrug efflux pump subunit AcrB